MKHRAGLASCLAVMLSTVADAQPQEFARILRDGEQATLSVFGPRPVDLAAKQLADEFGAAVNVEDPVYLYRDDVDDVTPPRVASEGRRVLIPKAAVLEIRVDLRSDGSLQDVQKAVADLVDAANAQLPFAYRIDRDGDTFTLVPTRTRDEQGRSIDVIPLLDRRVSIPLGTRRFDEHVNLLTHALEQQTGFRISCCSAGASQAGPLFEFGADNEPARTALLRLLRSRPVGPQLDRSEPRAYRLVPSEPHYQWLMRCQPGQSWCFINVARIPSNPSR